MALISEIFISVFIKSLFASESRSFSKYLPMLSPVDCRNECAARLSHKQAA